MEDEQIEVVKNWPKLTSVRDIQVFISFANFYQRFIRGFSRIAALLTFMLKITGSSELAPKVFRVDDNEVVGVGGRVNETVKNSSKSKKLKINKSEISMRSSDIKTTGEPIFLTPNAREVFTLLKQAFIQAPILQHFNLESHIRIKTNASGYAIGGVLDQLSFDWVALDFSNLTKFNFGQWHPVAYFSRKMLSAETRYKRHNAKLLAIVEAFKTWRHYLKGCKLKVLVLTNHNNLCWFIDTKSLSSCQV